MGDTRRTGHPPSIPPKRGRRSLLLRGSSLLLGGLTAAARGRFRIVAADVCNLDGLPGDSDIDGGVRTYDAHVLCTGTAIAITDAECHSTIRVQISGPDKWRRQQGMGGRL